MVSTTAFSLLLHKGKHVKRWNIHFSTMAFCRIENITLNETFSKRNGHFALNIAYLYDESKGTAHSVIINLHQTLTFKGLFTRCLL